jgi:hypothetical protein
MPYVKSQLREALDPAIRDLARAIVDAARELPEETGFAGLLNYACTSIAIQVIEGRFGKIRYGTIATVTGVFKNVADEFYRRVAVPYEDRQIADNGDVALYEEYAKRSIRRP